MNIWVSISFLIAISMATADELSDCKCGTGYQATKNDEGKVQCTGILLLHNKPCNIPEHPQCVCTGTVTGILKDNTGLWCSESKQGKEQRRWHCENTQEWETFFKEHPELASEDASIN